jgi:3-hydroxyphenylacetate 6-hydroxylase
MCADSLLANRELYSVFMTMLSCFEIVGGSEIDTDPVTGSAHSTSLVTVPRSYEVYFKPRNKDRLGRS